MSEFLQNHPKLTAAFAAVTAVGTIGSACLAGAEVGAVTDGSILGVIFSVATEALFITGGIAAIHKLAKAAYGF